jgi:hypothetical protein
MKPVRQQTFDAHEFWTAGEESDTPGTPGSAVVRVLELSDAEALEVCRRANPPIRPFWPVPTTHWSLQA